MRILVLLGAPGAGKGTQATILAQRLGLPHVATGDLFRAAVRAGTALGREAQRYMERGELVPDAITVDMLIERIDRPDAREGVILDGFPRSRNQAEALEAALLVRGVEVERALLVDVPAEDLVGRLSGRWVCRLAGHPFHIITNPPRIPGICDVDGSPLEQREDDRPEVVRARLARQLPPMQSVVEHYRARGVLRTVDGRQPIEDVTRDLLAAVETVRPQA
ncbi:MAG: adenylate kinase [Chloroflexi bacterium]|nr:adenylate kinase [Chloroflexota bacterium]